MTTGMLWVGDQVQVLRLLIIIARFVNTKVSAQNAKHHMFRVQQYRSLFNLLLYWVHFGALVQVMSIVMCTGVAKPTRKFICNAMLYKYMDLLSLGGRICPRPGEAPTLGVGDQVEVLRVFRTTTNLVSMKA